jgi:hypothetical protein
LFKHFQLPRLTVQIENIRRNERQIPGTSAAESLRHQPRRDSTFPDQHIVRRGQSGNASLPHHLHSTHAVKRVTAIQVNGAKNVAAQVPLQF